MKLKNILNEVGVGFSDTEAREFVTAYTTPFINFLLWLVPIGATIAILVSVVIWFGKEEAEKEQRPVSKTIKMILFWAVIAESVMVILKVVGLA